MLNQFLLVGKVTFVDKIIHTMITIDNGEYNIPVMANNNLSGIELIKVGDFIAVKGNVIFKYGNTQLMVEKMSWIS